MVVVVVFYVPSVQYYSMKRFFSEIIVPTDSFSFILIFKKIIASKMPRKRASEAVQQDTTRNQQGRSDKPAQDRESINKRRRDRYAQRTLQERENDNARRRKKRAEQSEEERAQVNEQRRRLRDEQSEEECAQVNEQRRRLRDEQSEEERAQVNDGRRETYAERRARNLGKTRNNFIREPEASLDDIKLHSVGELCLTCRKCDARLFKGERTAAGNTFSFCCAQGQVQIPRIPRPPSPLDDYLSSSDCSSRRRRRCSLTCARSSSACSARFLRRRALSFSRSCKVRCA